MDCVNTRLAVGSPMATYTINFHFRHFHLIFANKTKQNNKNVEQLKKSHLYVVTSLGFLIQFVEQL